MLIHEIGHVLGAKAVGMNNVAVYIWPGYELYPDSGVAFEGGWLIFMSFGAMLQYDLLFFYSLLPTLFDLHHLIFLGGGRAEPLNATVELGLPKYVALSLVVFLSSGMFAYLYKIRKMLGSSS